MFAGSRNGFARGLYALPYRLLTVVAAAFVLFAAPAPLVWTPAEARDAPSSFADLAERLLPAVVNIATTQQVPAERRRGDIPQPPPGSPLEDLFRDFFGDRGNRPDRPRRGTSLGSGFVIDPSGYIVTNNHVIDGADEITVLLHDDTQLKAKLVARDSKVDIAVLKVEPPNRKPMPFVKFGDSDKSRIGDWVVAIGNPFGLGGTVTAGIVSARSRDIGGQYDDYIQTDAAINKGNSGGPLFNMDGEVIGINTAIYSPTGTSLGIGFAIPSNMARPLVEQLREFGRVRRGWIGVQIQSISEDMAESFGLDKPRGALIAGVTPNGPAEKAGLKQRDVILSFDGKDVPDSKKLPRIVAESKVGDTVEIVVMRGGKRANLKLKVGELEDSDKQTASAKGGSKPPAPKEAEPPGTIEPFGITVARLTDTLREKHGLQNAQKGVVVVKVAEGSPAAEKGLKVGDLILEVAQVEVNSPGDVQNKVKELLDQKKKAAVLLVESKGDPRFVALRFQK
ncbi:MAG: DegQ family serine endoprotease [Alphaproteobacteria bacterium]|nr:DegQ family serine endoprotease [Alphaproteobacteria bacterium]